MSGVAVVGAARAENRGGRLTRLALIECAERMFSQRGIDAVSVAEILDAAGQRNKNAVHYHFGGKEALVTAIAEHRSRALNARRAELLSELRRRGNEHDIRALCATLVEPLAELLDADGCHFLGFLARYHLDRSRRQLVASVDPRVTRTYRDAYRLLAEASGLSRSAMEIRFEIAMGMIFTSLASRQTQESSSRGSGRVSRGVFVEHLVAGVTGCFTTPTARSRAMGSRPDAVVTAHPSSISERFDRLVESDAQFRAALPDRAVDEQRARPELGLAQVVAVCMEGYGDRPALAERVTRTVIDPATGRVTREPIDRFETISYRELWARACALSSWWHERGERGLRADELICLLGSGSIDFVTTDVAAIRLGAVSVPLQTNAPIEQLIAIVGEAQPKWIATSVDSLETAVEVVIAGHRPAGLLVFDHHEDDDRQCEILDAARARLAGARFDELLVALPAICAGAERPDAPLFDRADTAGRLSTIYYTSGSTGTPKGAMYPERLIAWAFRARLRVPDITLHYLPMNHSFGRGSVLSALGNGGTTYFSADNDLSGFFDDLRLVRPTFLGIVPRVCELLYQRYQRDKAERRRSQPAPDDTGLDDELIARMRDEVLGGRLLLANFGSAALAPDLREFMGTLLGFPLPDNYGSTEVAGVVRNTRVLRPPVIDYKLVDVPELGYYTTDQPHPRGELLVKTENVMLGYYRRADITAQVFDDDGFYRTGDIMAELEADRLVYVDRRSSVIKLAQGEFVAISQLEAVFTNGHPAIHQVYLHGTSDRAFLLAVIVPNDQVLEELGVADDDQTTRRVLRDAITSVAHDHGLHPFEVPRDFLVEHEPFTVDNGLLAGLGKYRRPKLDERYKPRLEQVYADLAAGQVRALDQLRHSGGRAAVLDVVCQVVQATLGIDAIDLSTDPGFGRLGGDSLAAVECSALFEEIYGVEVPANVISSPTGTLRQLAAFIERERDPTRQRATFASVHGRDATEIRASDLTLDRFIDGATLGRAAGAAPPGDEIRTVLVTGANGFLGRFLCLDWLERLAPVGGRVISVVRASDDAAARCRVAEVFDSGDAELVRRFEELAGDHLEVLAGDLAEPRLGLAPGDWERLATDVDLIVHPAAMVNHVLSYAQLFGPNVVGTAEMIRLALTDRLTRFAAVSTVAAAFAPGGRALDEDTDVRQATPIRRLRDDVYADGYAHSKWAGEVLLREAHDLFGLPVTVFRSDMIMAHSRYGGQINVPDLFSRWLFSIVASGLAPRSFYAPSAVTPHYDGLPVDFTAEAISTLGTGAGSSFRTFHVVNPHEDGISMDTFVDWVTEAGHPITRIDDYDDFLVRFEVALRSLPEEDRQRSMLPLLHQLRRPAPAIAGALVPAERFCVAVRDCEVGGDGAIPHLSAEYIRKYLDDLRVVGLI